MPGDCGGDGVGSGEKRRMNFSEYGSPAVYFDFQNAGKHRVRKERVKRLVHDLQQVAHARGRNREIEGQG